MGRSGRICAGIARLLGGSGPGVTVDVRPLRQRSCRFHPSFDGGEEAMAPSERVLLAHRHDERHDLAARRPGAREGTPRAFEELGHATIDMDLNANEPAPGSSGPENGHEMTSPRQLIGRIQLKPRRKCRSRPVSRVRNTVGMGRFRGRPVATSGRKHSRRRDWRRQVVSLARQRKADYVRCNCLTVNCEMAPGRSASRSLGFHHATAIPPGAGIRSPACGAPFFPGR